MENQKTNEVKCFNMDGADLSGMMKIRKTATSSIYTIMVSSQTKQKSVFPAATVFIEMNDDLMTSTF